MKITLYAAALCSILINSSAIAACVQGDLTGVWRVYGSGVSSQGYYSWTRCKVTVENNGAFNTSRSWCKEYLGTTTSVQGGSLSVSSACRVSGQININGFITTLVEAQLNRSKDVISGVAESSNAIGTITAIKK